ncbi:metaxin-2-like [Diorhabda carinulata]|uniref:metaxin-2-like n=1 Tax=Diorhabda carinulata TaxID=1163345 RepID=UPI0025A200C6|nr:metaxin-2-like [Diorhabda carinulata]
MKNLFQNTVMGDSKICDKDSKLKTKTNKSFKMNTADGKTMNGDEIKRGISVDFSVLKDTSVTTLPVVGSPSENACGTNLQWQEKITIITPLLSRQMILPELSNCLAVQAFLKMCNLGFEIERRSNAAAMSPTNTVPFIKIDKYVIGGLEGIVQFVNTKNITLTDKLDNNQKVNLKAFFTLAMNKFNLVELYMCWRHQETYKNVTSQKNGSVYPWPLNWIQNITKRHQVSKQLKNLDWKEKTLNEVIFEFEVFCEALSQRLNGKSQFFDEGDTELDACVFGHLFSILHTPLPGNYLSDTIKTHPDLMKLVNRIKKLYF